MNRRILSIVLLICMVVTMLPTGAIAAESSAPICSLEMAYGDSYIAPEETGEPITYGRKTQSTMEASQELIDFIKASEGFSQYAMWDYSQWSIGYGSRCDPDDYPDGITEEEAEALLRTFVDDWVVVVNAFIDRHSLTKTQYEFDALVCFCYGVGNAWMYNENYNIYRYAIEGCTELEFVNCIGSWVSAGGQVLTGLIYRRMREANIYCNGDYSRTENLYQDVPYGCVTFDANGGSVSMSRIYTIRGQSYRAFEAFPEPTRNGYYFAGWFDADGKQYTSDTICTTVLTTLKAKWSTNADDYFSEDGYAPEPPKPDLVAGFTDVTTDDWFAEYVEQAVEMELFNGVTQTEFKPLSTMTRAMFVQVIYRMYGQPTVSGSLPFEDVPTNAWYYEALLWAYEAGIVNGVGANRFAPDADVTRQQIAKMLYQYCSLCGNADLESLQPLDQFADADCVDAYAVTSMQWAVGNGIITGVDATTLAPKKSTLRAQAATMLVRYTEKFHCDVSAASEV